MNINENCGCEKHGKGKRRERRFKIIIDNAKNIIESLKRRPEAK